MFTMLDTKKIGVIRLSTLGTPSGVYVYKNSVDILFGGIGELEVGLSVMAFTEDIHPHLGHRPTLISSQDNIDTLLKKRHTARRLKKQDTKGPVLVTIILPPVKSCFYVFYALEGNVLPFHTEVSHDVRVRWDRLSVSSHLVLTLQRTGTLSPSTWNHPLTLPS